MASPLVNTKDFSIEAPFNSTNFIGWDPLSSLDPMWNSIVRRIYYDQDGIDIMGPMVESGTEMFCAHLAVPYPGYNLTVDGKGISTWGFVMHSIHWTRLKEQSGIDARFEEKGYNYRLTRTDQNINPETGETESHVSFSSMFCLMKRISSFAYLPFIFV